jgi:GNAT superfamily N-acetyltransferase
MPPIDVEVNCPVFDSFRVRQVGGMFDVPLTERASQRFRVEVPEGVVEEGGGRKAEGGAKMLPSPFGRGVGGEGLQDSSQSALTLALSQRERELSDPPSALHLPPFFPPWSLGLIVGPSGSGKSTMARAMFGDCVYRTREWPQDQAVIDGLGQKPIKEITKLFTAVGFSSPPSWIKPYRVLSNGEQFRCDLARALAEGGINDKPPIQHSSFSVQRSPLVVFDEFTSVVDRNVAKVVSAAIAKGIHAGQIGCRFVAVTCHYDVTEWLEPDWVIDMATGTFHRRCLRRPPINLEIVRCRRSAWQMFARHHYLSGALTQYARCFLALWEGVPVAFCATVSLIGRKNRWRISRIVTLPDYQGIGVGMAVAEAVAEIHLAEGHRMNITGSHPAVIAHCRRSPHWRTVNVQKSGSSGAKKFIDNYRGSAGRAVVSFEYLGERD